MVESSAQCPDCKVERADYEGPDGAWLPKCPNCQSSADPVLVVVEDDPGELVHSLVDELRECLAELSLSGDGDLAFTHQLNDELLQR